jgi:hypothetical protein
MSIIVPPIPTFRIKTSDYNTSNLRDLAASLFQAITSICSSGASISLLQVNLLNANNINATGATIANLNGNIINFTGATINNLTAFNETVINLTGTNLSYTSSLIGNGPLYLTGSSSINGHINTTGGNYTATLNNYAILFTGAGPSTLTLPLVASVPGITFKVFNDTASALSFALSGSDKYLGTGASIFALTGHSATILTSDGFASWWNV